jgi:hypothetical protein
MELRKAIKIRRIFSKYIAEKAIFFNTGNKRVMYLAVEDLQRMIDEIVDENKIKKR